MLSQIESCYEQDIAKTILKKYLKGHHPPPLLLFHGPSGVGKYLSAESFINQALCEKGTVCGECKSCRNLLREEHPDFIRFPQDKIFIGQEKNPEIFTIRWLLQTRICFRPILARLRFILLPCGENIQNEAETALLKTLEESPEHTRFIILTNDISKIKKTIISRAISIPFYLLSQDSIKKITKLEDKLDLQCLGGSLDYAPILRNDLYPQLKSKIQDAGKTPTRATLFRKIFTSPQSSFPFGKKTRISNSL